MSEGLIIGFVALGALWVLVSVAACLAVAYLRYLTDAE